MSDDDVCWKLYDDDDDGYVTRHSVVLSVTMCYTLHLMYYILGGGHLTYLFKRTRRLMYIYGKLYRCLEMGGDTPFACFYGTCNDYVIVA